MLNPVFKHVKPNSLGEDYDVIAVYIKGDYIGILIVHKDDNEITYELCSQPKAEYDAYMLGIANAVSAKMGYTFLTAEQFCKELAV